MTQTPAQAAPRYGIRKLLLDVVVPVALYYVLRAFGASVYVALLIGAVLPAVTTLAGLARHRTLDRLGAYMLTTLLLGVAVSLFSGSPRFLLAKEAWVTAIAGGWFLYSAGGRQPLSFLFARTLLEGRQPFTQEPWDDLWERVPEFRRGWRISSVIWGLGLLADAALRVVIAYSLPVDLVPAITAVLFPATAVVLIGIDQINQHRTGLRRVLLGRPVASSTSPGPSAPRRDTKAKAKRTERSRSSGTGPSPAR